MSKWSSIADKLSRLNFLGALRILLGIDKPWAFEGESGDDDPLPNTDPPPTHPNPPPTATYEPVGACFAVCVRFDIDTDKRDKILASLPLIRVGQWEQRRSEHDTPQTLATRMASMCAMTGDRRIVLGLDWFEAEQPGYAETAAPKEWARMFLQSVKPYWSRVDCVEVCDEPSDAGRLAVAMREYRDLERELGLPAKLTSVTVCRDPDYVASIPEIDILAIEAYAANPAEANTFDAGTAQGKILLGLEAASAAVKRTGKRVALVIQAYARNPHPTKRWNLWNMRVLVAQFQAAAQWAERNRDSLSWVLLFSAGRSSGFASPDAPDVWDALWPSIKRFSERWHGSTAPYPALPPDPRPGAIKRIEVSLVRYLDQHGYPNGPSDPPKPLPYPVRGGDVLFRVRAYDANRELTQEELADKRFLYGVSWDIACGGQTITAEVLGAAPWHRVTQAPFATFADVRETTQSLWIKPECPSDRIKIRAVYGTLSSEFVTPIVGM